MHDPILHICDHDSLLFISRRSWIFYSSRFLQPIKRSPRLIQYLTHFLGRLRRKCLIPHIFFMLGFLIVPIRIFCQIQFFIMLSLIIAYIPQFRSRIIHMTYYIGLRFIQLYDRFARQQHVSPPFSMPLTAFLYSVLYFSLTPNQLFPRNRNDSTTHLSIVFAAARDMFQTVFFLLFPSNISRYL